MAHNGFEAIPCKNHVRGADRNEQLVQPRSGLVAYVILLQVIPWTKTPPESR